MNNHNELLKLLVNLGFINIEHIKKYQKPHKYIIDVLLEEKIINYQQLNKAQQLLKDSTNQYLSSPSLIQNEFMNFNVSQTKDYVSSVEHFKNEFEDLQVSKAHVPTEKITSSSSEYLQNSAAKTKNFSRYSIKKELGKGGMGVVYEAYDNKLNRDIALKFLLKEEKGKDREKFEQEARLMAKLDHPNIIKVFDFGLWKNKNYFSMELIEGRDFAKLKDNLSLQQCLVILMKSCLAVHHAHQEGIIHRDLKPANIMVSKDYIPKVMDFGLARERDQKVSQSMAIEGTVQYMSPEQTTGKIKDIDARSDVYSLGVILYEILTGDIPFTGEFNSIILQIVKEDPKAPTKVRPSISKDLEAICLKCLEKDKNARYRSAKLLAEDIDNYLQNRPIVAKPATWHQKMWKWSKRNKAVASTIATSLFVLTLFLTWTWHQENIRSAELTFLSKQEQQIDNLRKEFETCIANKQQIIKTLSSLEASLANIRSNLLLVKNNMSTKNVFVAKNLLENKTLQSYEDIQKQINENYQSFLEVFDSSDKKVKEIQKEIVHKRITLEQNRQYKVENDLNSIREGLLDLKKEIGADLENVMEKLFFSLKVKKESKITEFRDVQNILTDLKKGILTSTNDFKYSLETNFYDIETLPIIDGKLNQFSSRYAFEAESASLRDTKTEKIIKQFSLKNISQAAFSPKNKYFALGNDVGDTEIYTIGLNKVTSKKLEGEVDYLQFSPNEKFLFVSIKHNPYVIFLDTMKVIPLQRYHGMKYGFFSYDSKYLGLSLGRDASYSSNVSPILDLDNIGTSSELYAEVNSKSYALVFDRTNRFVYLGDLRSLIIYDLKNKRNYSRIENAHSSSIISLDISSDNNYIATYGKEGVVKIRNTNNFNTILSSQVEGYLSKSPSIKYQNGYNMVFYTRDFKTHFEQSEKLKKLDISIDNITSLRDETNNGYDIYKNRMQYFTYLSSSDDKRYLCCYIFPRVSVWDLQENKLVFEFFHQLYEVVNYLDISFDNRYLLLLENTRLQIVDLHQKKVIFNKNNKRSFRNVSRFSPGTNYYTSFKKDLNKKVIELIFTNIVNGESFAIDLPGFYAIQDISIYPKSKKVFVSRAFSRVEIYNMQTGDVEKVIKLGKTEKDLERICAISEDTFAGGNEDGEFILYSEKEGIKARFFVYNEIKKIKFDPKEKRFWIFTQDRIFIYSILEKKSQDFFQMLYPIDVLEGYNLLAADINSDFSKLYVILTSGVFEISISNVF